jgi:hypothetical protein
MPSPIAPPLATQALPPVPPRRGRSTRANGPCALDEPEAATFTEGPNLEDIDDLVKRSAGARAHADAAIEDAEGAYAEALAILGRARGRAVRRR